VALHHGGAAEVGLRARSSRRRWAARSSATSARWACVRRWVADRILGALARPLELPGRERGIRASVGVAVADSGSMPADELLRNADVAMYATKHGGKDGYRIHHPGLAAPAPEPALA
jgi:GGDEF domain-containing protein